MWRIQQIFDGEYGCEEPVAGGKHKVSVTLVDENGKVKYESVEDENGLDVGSVWPYKFWGWEHADVPAVIDEYKGIDNPIDLYDALSNIWCADTCAPRMRSGWTKENRTLGQCSITAFLAQDIFGGKVYGILRPGGKYHCYNVIGDCKFDLTSEQFAQNKAPSGVTKQSPDERRAEEHVSGGEEALDYENNPEQFREEHFVKEEKRLRYEYLRAELKKYCEKK